MGAVVGFRCAPLPTSVSISLSSNYLHCFFTIINFKRLSFWSRYCWARTNTTAPLGPYATAYTITLISSTLFQGCTGLYETVCTCGLTFVDLYSLLYYTRLNCAFRIKTFRRILLVTYPKISVFHRPSLDFGGHFILDKICRQGFPPCKTGVLGYYYDYPLHLHSLVDD